MPHNPLRRYAELQDELLTRQAARSLRAFVEQAWPVLEPTTPFLPNWHIDLVCEHLEAITAGETTRLLINLPPRYMKSLLVSVFWPVWEWIASPSRRWICVSYSDALSLKLSLDRRTLVQSEWYQARWGHTVQLSSDQNVKGEFRNTRQGVMCATSVGGSATGKGGDRIIVDDLHNPQQADSDAQREAALRFFRETLSTRLDTPKTGAIVVVMQRLHEADLSARCLELEYRHLCLPVEADVATDIVFPVSGRVVTRAPGHLLWPAREARRNWPCSAGNSDPPHSTRSINNGPHLLVGDCSNEHGSSSTTNGRASARGWHRGICHSKAAPQTTTSSVCKPRARARTSTWSTA